MQRIRRKGPFGSTIANRLALTGILALACAVAFTVLCWDCLADGESPGATLRNLTIIGAAIIGLPLALWRSVVAHRQAETARLGLANDKYQNGAEMLGYKRRYVRLGGVYGLQHLAAVFRNASFRCANLDHAWLPGADLTEAGLANATLRWADLTGACLIGANLRSVDLSGANLTGANLSDCGGLIQAQLDLALARRDRAPTLTDALDNDTRELLIWRGNEHDGRNHQSGRPGVEHRVPLDSEHRFPTSTPGNVRQRRLGPR